MTNVMKGDVYIVAGTPGEHKHPATQNRPGPGFVFEFIQRDLPASFVRLPSDHSLYGAVVIDHTFDEDGLAAGYCDIVSFDPPADGRGILQKDGTTLIGVFIPHNAGKRNVAADLRRRYGEASMLLAADSAMKAAPPAEKRMLP